MGDVDQFLKGYRTAGRNPRTPITRDELLATLKRLKGMDFDVEVAHAEADAILDRFIRQGDKELSNAFRAVPKWYA